MYKNVGGFDIKTINKDNSIFFLAKGETCEDIPTSARAYFDGGYIEKVGGNSDSFNSGIVSSNDKLVGTESDISKTDGSKRSKKAKDKY